MKMTGAIRKQLNAFLEGFYDIIPKRLISIFNEQELELLISGLPTIDIDDLKGNTEYHKYQQTSLQVGVPPFQANYSGSYLHNEKLSIITCGYYKIIMYLCIVADSMVLASITLF